MADEIPHQVLVQKNFDKDCQHDIEKYFGELPKAITEYCIQHGTEVITEWEAVGEIKSHISKMLQLCKQLYFKYHEDSQTDKTTGITTTKQGYATLKRFEKEINDSPFIYKPRTIEWLDIIQENEIKDIAVKHRLMDKTMDKQPWEKEVKKKFFLNEVPEEEWAPHEAYLNSIKVPWKRMNFLETAFMVLKNGDIIKLISGINDSGKTWTSLPQAHQVNWYLRDYWARQKIRGIKDECLTQETLDDLAKVKPFSMKRDVSYYPDPEGIRAKIAEGTRFNTTPITEGMKAAINLKSWDPAVIDMILEIFTERASNNYMSFEYQLTRRPPKMLLSRFNVWQHKPSQKWLVLSMPSSVYRTEDPLFSKEIEKLKGDGNVSRWLVSKAGNTNFIAKMPAPKLKPRYAALFKKYRKEAKEEYEKGRKVKLSLGNDWYNKIAEYHKMVEEGQIAYIKIPDMLRARKLTDIQVTQFLRDYNKWDRMAKLNAPEPVESQEGEAE